MKKQKWRNDQNRNAMSGSELMMTELEKRLKKDLDDFQFILSRPSLHELDETKIRLLWCHDLANDPQIGDPALPNTLSNNGWKKYHKIIFVSHWQQQRFIEKFQIPWDRTVVLKNAINPIEVDLDKKYDRKPDDVVNLCYTTTPHRGLGILVPVFQHMAETDKNIHLHVFSSFKIYGWEQRDQQFEPLYNAIKEHPQMTYHGTVPNETLKKTLAEDMHIHAYPSTWVETSCVSLMEAMSAGLLCVHPNHGALYETSSNWTFMYNYFDDPQKHMSFFHHMLTEVVKAYRGIAKDDGLKIKLAGQKSFCDLFYNWDVRETEWRAFLNSMRNVPREFEKETQTFNYRVG